MEFDPAIPMQSTQKRKTRILKPSQIMKKKRDYVQLAGEIGESIGPIELGSRIFITGRSYSGKSSFITKLCALFSEHFRVDYNNHEEKGGDASTVMDKMKLAGIDAEHDNKIRFYKAPIESEEEETFTDILNRKNSAGFAVLDSVQHAEMNKKQYVDFTHRFCNTKRKKIIAFICHYIKNDYVKFLYHDCDIKLEVMHYVVYVESRMSGATNKPIVIYEEGAKRGWGKNYKKVIEGKYWPGKR